MLERYRTWMQTVADSAPVAVMAVDREGRVIFWNRSAEEIFGWSAGEVLGRPNPIVPPADRDWYHRAIEEVLAGRPQQAVELERRRRDGSPVWIRLTNTPLVEPGGEPSGVIAVAEDITGAVRARRRLARIQRALRSRAALAGAIARCESEEALYRAACRAAVEEAGYRLAWVGIAGDDGPRRVRPVAQAGFEEGYLERVRITWDDAETGRGPTGTAIRTGKPAVAADIEHDPRFAPWREDALRRGYRSSAALPLLADGRPVGTLNLYAAEPDAFDEEELELLSGLASDLSLAVSASRARAGRVDAERRAGITEDRLDHILGASPAVLYTLRASDFTPTWVSGNLTEVLGYTPEEALKPGWWRRHIHPRDLDRALEATAGLVEAGAAAHEYRFFRADGSEIWVRDVLRLVRGDAGEPREIIGVWVDITDRRRAEESLRRTLEGHAAELAAKVAERTRELAARTEEAERLSRELETFAYSVSHDLRAPLRAIDGFGQALAGELGGALDERQRDHLNRIRAAAQRMGRMIDGLLELSRASRVEMEPAEADLSALAAGVVAELREAEPHREVTVSVERGLATHGDPRLLRLLLQNLIGNAWKFTAGRGDATIEVGRLDEAGGCFYVRDNGVGFDLGHADKLFAPFQRLHRREEFPGEGVGLATVQRIVARHGGRVWAKAEPGAGATFFFTLWEGGNP